jgi:hypothetical protein
MIGDSRSRTSRLGIWGLAPDEDVLERVSPNVLPNKPSASSNRGSVYRHEMLIKGLGLGSVYRHGIVAPISFAVEKIAP